MADPVEHHDILVLGAGLSGINTAYVLGQSLPHRPYTILEARDVIGGTWSFFRYPGFRTDSYMTSFGFRWFPWSHAVRMASGPEILQYLEDAVDFAGLRDKIRFGHRVVAAEWRSEEQQWRVTVEVAGERKVYSANFVIGCTGYYSYDRAFETTIPGLDSFQGQVVHPQWWPEDLDYSGKRIVVIGSGATAITLLPVLSEKASTVTQLQRSPSYVVGRSRRSKLTPWLQRFLPLSWALWLTCWIDTIMEVILTQGMLKFPKLGRRLITDMTKSMLPDHIDADIHFNPSYGPFQQRLNMTPGGEYFKALRKGNADIVTDLIDTVTSDGILLKSGRTLPADIIVTATGLHVELFNGITPLVDGQPIVVGSHFTWRGCMLDSLPNMAFIMGYVTQSWTPGADMMARIVVRVLKRMEATGSTSVMPVMENPDAQPKILAVSATSTYFVKAADNIPKVTGKGVWYGRTHLVTDAWAYLFGSVTKSMLYTKAGGHTKEA